MVRFFKTIAILASALFIVSMTASVFAQGFGKNAKDKGIFADLTKEQREAIRTTRSEMRENGSSREEIHAAVGQLLESYGVELPEDWNDRPRARRGKGIFADLTEEQREAIRTTKTEMRENGSSREEIHAAVGQLLESYGVELPEDWDEKSRFRGHPPHFQSNLNEEQRENIKTTISEMKENGADRDEIHAAVTKLLESYGIESPPKDHRRHFWANLTDDQRETLHARKAELIESGATHEEIRAEMSRLLQSYGIELPQCDKSGQSYDQKTSNKIDSPEIRLNSFNYPNPFNPQTTITFDLPESDYATVRVYDTAGKFITSLIDAQLEAGNYSVVWDGRYDNGKTVDSGVYFYKIDTENYSESNQMILLK